VNDPGAGVRFGLVDGLAPISLSDLDAAASLQRRRDRKYILTGAELGDLIADLAPRLRVLEISRRRTFRYQSIYFDTSDYESYRGAAHRRRRRFKVRTRTYLDTGTSMLEVKTKGAGGVTVKTRQPHPLGQQAVLGGKAQRFVGEVMERPDLGPRLHPMLETTYDRTTLVDLAEVARLTIDACLVCTNRVGDRVQLDDRYIVETKSRGSLSPADRRLRAQGIRPENLSKYCTGLAATNPALPSNKWHRTLHRHFRSR